MSATRGRCQKAGSRIRRSHLEPQLQQIGLERGQRALERAAELVDHARRAATAASRAAGSASNCPSCFTSASSVSARRAPPALSSAS